MTGGRLFPSSIGSKGNIGAVGISKSNWMGYGIRPSKEPEVLSIDILPFLSWCNDFSLQNDVRHTIVIADDLAVYNGLDLSSAREVGEKKRQDLVRLIRHHNLDSIDILQWKDILKESGYQAVLESFKGLVLEDSGLRSKLQEAVPKRYRGTGKDILQELGYVLEELAVTFFLNETGHPIKVGHHLERPYDTRTLMIYSNREYRERLCIKSAQPLMVYLRGGHTLDARHQEDVIPPYLVVDPSRRITYVDTADSVSEKLQRSSPLYQTWCREILEMADQIPPSGETKTLAHQLYERLIEPVGMMR